MEQVQDCATMEESLHDVYEKPSSDELGDLRCSDLDVPMFTPEIYKPILISFLCNITNEQWMILAAGNIDTNVIFLLYNMCHELVEETSVLVLQVVAPQVLDWLKLQSSLDEACSSKDTFSNRNYCRVTEEDIQASIGDSLHLSFVEALGVNHQWPQADQLLELIVAEVKRKVNKTLSQISKPSSFAPEPEEQPTEPQTCDSPTLDMVYLVGHILKSTKEVDATTDNQECMDSNNSKGCCPDEVTEIQAFKEKDTTAEPVNIISDNKNLDLLESLDNQECMDSNNSKGCCPDEVTEIQAFKEKDTTAEPVNIISDNNNLDLLQSLDNKGCLDSNFSKGCCPDEVTEVQVFSYEDDIAESQRENTFFIVFVSKLVEHIAASTRTSIFEVDIDMVLAGLRDRIGGKSGFTLPKNVGNIHISVYKKLCREFGSARLLQAAMVSNDVSFEDAVVRTLKAQLQKSSGETSSFMKKVRSCFHRVTPACTASNIPASHLEVVDSPPPNTRKRPAIIRMFSFMAKTLRRPFTSCINGSQDD